MNSFLLRSLPESEFVGCGQKCPVGAQPTVLLSFPITPSIRLEKSGLKNFLFKNLASSLFSGAERF